MERLGLYENGNFRGNFTDIYSVHFLAKEAAPGALLLLYDTTRRATRRGTCTKVGSSAWVLWAIAEPTKIRLFTGHE